MPYGIISSIIAAGAQAGASAGSGKMNRREASRNRDFQERMSNTAYQRAMEDMRKAGLNPILAYQQGGAGTPGGSMGNQPDMGASVSTGVQAFKASQESKRLGQELKNMSATEKYTAAQMATAVSQANQLDTSARGIELDNTYKTMGLPAAQAQADFDMSAAGQELRKFKRFMEGLGTIGSGVVGAVLGRATSKRGTSAKSISPSTGALGPLGVNKYTPYTPLPKAPRGTHKSKSRKRGGRR